MWVILSLIAALTQATSWALKKKMMQNLKLNLHIAAISSVISGAILISITLIQGILILDWKIFLIWGLVTAILDFIAVYVMLLALDVVDLGYLTTWLTVTSFTVILPPIFFLRELPSMSALFGIFLVFIGAYLLEASQSKNTDHRVKWFILILGVCLTFLATTTKLTIQASSPLTTSVFIYLVLSILFGFALLFKKSRFGPDLNLGAKSRISGKLWSVMVITGILATIETLSLYVALDMQKVSYVISLKRIAPFFALIFGYYWFNEQVNLKKITAMLCIIIGAVIISIFS